MVLVVRVVLVVMRVGKAVGMGMRMGAVLIRTACVRRRGPVAVRLFVIMIVHGAGVPRADRRVNGGVIA